MSRTVEQKKYHAAKERSYRVRRRQERDRAMVAFAEAAASLRRAGYTVGQLVDLLVKD